MKRALKYISVFLAVLISLSNISFAFNTMAAAPSRACIDTPTSSTTVSGSVTITGWSISPNGVKQVAVYINNNKVGNASLGLSRPDVNRVFNSSGTYKGASNSGFTYTLDTTAYQSGTYSVKIVSTGNNGSTVSVTSSFRKTDSQVCIDLPKNGTNINSDVTVSGWSLDRSGVNHVDILVDGKKVGSAKTGISRPDVNRVKNSSGIYKGAAQSGYSYQLSYGDLGTGSHRVSVDSYGNDGTKASAYVDVKSERAAPLANIDRPKNSSGFLRDTLLVTGWSLSSDGVKSVEVFLDGNSLGLAAIGQERRDVNTIINGNNAYKNGVNSGFSLTAANLSGYKTGTHVVKVVSTGNNGDTATQETKVQKVDPIAGFDQSGYSFNNSVTVTGWSLNPTGVKRVDIYYGSNMLGSVTPSLDSSDVQAKYDKDGIKYKTGEKNRFTFTLNVSTIPSGSGTLTAKCIGNDDSVASATATVKIEKPGPLTCIDTPSNGQNLTYNDKTIVVSGWALQASGVKSISVYVDDKQVQEVTTGLTSDRGILNVSAGRYKDDANARFTTGPVDISGLSYAKHTVKVVTVGFDGGSYTLTTTFNKSQTSFTKYNIDVSSMASKNNCSVDLIDPNIIKSKNSAGIYQFMTLNYVEGITAADLNRMLENCGVLTGKGQVFLDAGKTYNINPVYLVAHARVESGNGTSKLSAGINVPAGTYTFSGKTKSVAAGTYYNQYGINAVDNNPLGQGSTYAAFSGWNSVDASIKGGAEWIARIYIWGGSPNQDTIYEMRFDPGYWDGTYKRCYQYATAKTWAQSIASIVAQYKDIFNGIDLTFDIPQYR